MTTERVTKKLYYLRVENKKNLVDIISDIKTFRKIHPTVRSTLVILAGVNYEIMHYKEHDDIVFLHISSSETGRTSIAMNMLCQTHEDNGRIQLPPTDHEYVTKEAYMLIKNHHVIFCGHGLSQQAVASYLNEVLYSSEPEKNIAFTHVANVDKLAIIKKQGVKEIVFGSSLYDMSLEKANAQKRDADFKEIMSIMIKTLQEKLSLIVAKDLSEGEKKMMENLHVGVSLKLKGNKRAELASKEKIKEAAKEIVLDEDLTNAIRIVTSDNVSISGEDTKLQKPVSLPRLGRSNSLEYTKTWEALEAYYQELEEQKLTEI